MKTFWEQSKKNIFWTFANLSYPIRNDSVLNHIKRLTKRFDKDWNISNKTNNFKWMILSRNNFNFQSQIPLLDKITWQGILDNYHRVLNCLQNDLTNNYDQVLNFFSFYFHKSRRGSSKSDDDLQECKQNWVLRVGIKVSNFSILNFNTKF